MTRYYPMMLNIENKRCIVVGGGNVALRKINTLLEYLAKVTVISESICEELKDLTEKNKIEWIQRNYQTGDIADAALVFAATDDKETNINVHNEARSKDIPVNISDNPGLCDFIVPSKFEQGDLTIAISTNGKSPMLAKKIRTELESSFDSYYATFLNIMDNLRQKALDEISEEKQRQALYKELVYSDILDALKKGEEVRDRIQKIFEKYKSGK